MSQSVEIEPLRTYVVISLQLSALVQGLMLAVYCSCKSVVYQSLAILNFHRFYHFSSHFYDS